MPAIGTNPNSHVAENSPEGHRSFDTPVVQVAATWGKRLLQWMVWLWRHMWEIALRTDNDHVFMFAAGIAFNILTAMVPTVLLLLYVLGTVLDPHTIMQELNKVFTTYIVAEGYREDILLKLQAQITILVQNRGIAGLIGLIGLLWSASALASSIRVAINRVLRCRESRNYVIYKLYDFVAIMLIGILVFVSIITGPLLQLLLAAGDRIGEALHLAQFEGFISFGVNFVITLFLFYVIFRYMPYQRQERHIVLVGTLVSTGLWELARYVFSLYVTEFGTLGRVYGTYAFFAAAALWIYVSALVFLIGAEVAYHVKQSRWNAQRLFNRLAEQARR